MISFLPWNLLQIKVLFVIFHNTIVYRTSFFLSFFERMLMLSITENGLEPLVFLVMTIFGECIQLKFRQIISENHILVSVLCSRMRFALQYLCKYWAKPHVRLNGFDGLVREVMALVYSETAGHSSIIFLSYRTMRKYLGW